MTARKDEIAVREFAERIQMQITEFAETYSMDEMLILDPRIADDWTECTRCESAITETQANAYGFLIQEIMNLLNSEF